MTFYIYMSLSLRYIVWPETFSVIYYVADYFCDGVTTLKLTSDKNEKEILLFKRALQ